jgi:hypothetical protein
MNIIKAIIILGIIPSTQVFQSCSTEFSDVVGAYQNKYCEKLTLSKDFLYVYESGQHTSKGKWKLSSDHQSILLMNWLEYDDSITGVKQVTFKNKTIWISLDDQQRNFIKSFECY